MAYKRIAFYRDRKKRFAYVSTKTGRFTAKKIALRPRKPLPYKRVLVPCRLKPAYRKVAYKLKGKPRFRWQKYYEPCVTKRRYQYLHKETGRVIPKHKLTVDPLLQRFMVLYPHASRAGAQRIIKSLREFQMFPELLGDIEDNYVRWLKWHIKQRPQDINKELSTIIKSEFARRKLWRKSK